jgi:hypothetical protein
MEASIKKPKGMGNWRTRREEDYITFTKSIYDRAPLAGKHFL